MFSDYFPFPFFKKIETLRRVLQYLYVSLCLKVKKVTAFLPMHFLWEWSWFWYLFFLCVCLLRWLVLITHFQIIQRNKLDNSVAVVYASPEPANYFTVTGFMFLLPNSWIYSQLLFFCTSIFRPVLKSALFLWFLFLNPLY